MARSLNLTRRRPQLDAATALLALRALGCAHRPDVAVVDGAWLATCPGCHAPGSLHIRELGERDDDHRDPPVSVGCQRRCADPADLAAILLTDPDVLEARAEARTLASPLDLADRLHPPRARRRRSQQGASARGGGMNARLRFLTPAEIRAATPVEPAWIWQGFAARGGVTLLGGKPKCGKSTLILAAIDAITSSAPAFLGREITGTPVVYVSEENAATLAHKLPASPDVRILTRDNAWPKPDWTELVSAVVNEATECGAGLVVIDTLAFWAAMAAEREKDAGAAQRVMQPILDAARLGIGFVIPVHQRKGDGDDGEGLRGSSAFAGAADIVIELERTTNPRQRALLTLSRYPSTPGTLVVSRDPATGAWAVVGETADRGDARMIADRQALLDALSDGDALTRMELQGKLGAPELQWHKTLDDLQHEHIIARSGAGKKGDPYRWQMVRTDAAHEPAQHCAETGQEVRLFSAALPVGKQQKQTSSVPSAETAHCAENETTTRPFADNNGEATDAEPISYLRRCIRQLAKLPEAEAQAAWERLEAELAVPA